MWYVQPCLVPRASRVMALVSVMVLCSNCCWLPWTVFQVYDLVIYLLTLGTHAHKGYSTSSVCLYVCISVTTSLAQLVDKSLNFGHEMRLCLNWANFAKNVSFKSYAAIRLPRWVLVGHILVWEWERVDAPWSGIPGVLRVQCSTAAGRAPLQLLLGDETNRYNHKRPG